jgi:hypothetical protein
MPRSCRYHCRRCGAHFTSLRAFDAHHEGSGENLVSCVFPEGAGLVEVAGGVCLIGDPTAPLIDVTLYERADSQEYRERMRATEGQPPQHDLSLREAA